MKVFSLIALLNLSVGLGYAKNPVAGATAKPARAAAAAEVRKPAKNEMNSQHKLENITVRGRSQVPRLNTEPEVIVAAPALPVDVPKEFHDELNTQINAARSD